MSSYFSFLGYILVDKVDKVETVCKNSLQRSSEIVRINQKRNTQTLHGNTTTAQQTAQDILNSSKRIITTMHRQMLCCKKASSRSTNNSSPASVPDSGVVDDTSSKIEKARLKAKEITKTATFEELTVGFNYTRNT